MPESVGEVYHRIVRATRRAAEGQCPECANVAPERIVWEDESWILSRAADADDLAVALLLQTREHSRVGQLDDELASQFGRIANRLVRIIENLPEAQYVDVSRYGEYRGHFHVWFHAPFADGTDRPVDLHTVAVKLANWGGDARG